MKTVFGAVRDDTMLLRTIKHGNAMDKHETCNRTVVCTHTYDTHRLRKTLRDIRLDRTRSAAPPAEMLAFFVLGNIFAQITRHPAVQPPAGVLWQLGDGLQEKFNVREKRLCL